eukprot:scaffold119377_cov36-Phaeocystis_antarctica.AAC.1
MSNQSTSSAACATAPSRCRALPRFAAWVHRVAAWVPRVAASVTYGCSLRRLRLQPPPHTVAGAARGHRRAVPARARERGTYLRWHATQARGLR